MSEKNLVVQDTGVLAPIMDVKDVLVQTQAIQRLMKDAMQDGEHYGKIPGCGDKPALLQSGAEKLNLLFGLCPALDKDKTDLPGGHREYEVTCTLKSRSGAFLGQGLGSATTMERKYRFRTGPAECTGKPVPPKFWDHRDKKLIGGDGFVAKKGNGDDDEKGWYIYKQGGPVEHDNPADYYNTVLKMACKRALVAAVKTTLATSDIFTQDIDDDPALYGGKVQDAEFEEVEKPEKQTKVSTVEEAPEPEPAEQGEQEEPEKKVNSAATKVPDTPQGHVWNELVELCGGDRPLMIKVLAEVSEWRGQHKTLKEIRDLTDKRAGVILNKLRAYKFEDEEPEKGADESDPFAG
jgi:hypothetical protein